MLLFLQWCCAWHIFRSQFPVTSGGFELRMSCIQSSYSTHSAIWRNGLGNYFVCKRRISSNPPAVTGISYINKSRAQRHRSLKLSLKLKYLSSFFFKFKLMDTEEFIQRGKSFTKLFQYSEVTSDSATVKLFKLTKLTLLCVLVMETHLQTEVNYAKIWEQTEVYRWFILGNVETAQ